MKPKRELLAYCDLYCGDCAGHVGQLADAAAALCEAIEAHQFDRTADCLFAAEIPHYREFRRTLAFLTGLRCEAPCRDRDVEASSCSVARCCVGKGLFACHECDAFESCDILRENADRCGYALFENIRAIRELGLDAWLVSGHRGWFRPVA